MESLADTTNSDELRDQHALSQEIVNTVTNANIGEPVDETELDAELEGMEQERIDEQMLNTGTVPVADKVGKLPAVANGEREYSRLLTLNSRRINFRLALTGFPQQ